MSAILIEARPYHCGALARSLRRDHAVGLRGLGIDPHRELRAALAASSFARALLLGGALAALGGVIGTLTASEGHVWLALAEHATVCRRAVYDQARRTIREIGAVKRSLVTTVFTDDAPAMTFARHLGFVRADIVGDGAMPENLIWMRVDLRDAERPGIAR